MAKTKAKAKSIISAKSKSKNPAKPAKGKGAKLVAKKIVSKVKPSKVAKSTKKPAQKMKPVAKTVLKKNVSKVKPTTKKLVVAKPIKKEIIKPINKKITPAPSKKTTTIAKLVSKRIESPTMMVGEKKIKLNFPKKRAGRKPKSKGGDDDDGFELLDVPPPLPRTPRKSTKIFVPPVSQEVYVNAKVKLEKPPKNFGTFKMFELEYTIHASPHSIYTFISTPAGLSEWFADNVNLRNDEYTFFWDGSQQVATLISRKENNFIKFRWNDEPDFTFFEFKIVVDEITSDVAFLITDWAEDELSKEASTMLWNSQIEALMRVLGA